MRFLPTLLLSLLSLQAFAKAPTYDTNCVELGKKWGWIKNYDPHDGHKRTIGKISDILKSASAIEDRVIQQLSIWENVDKVVPCLKDNAGMAFINGSFIIFDMVKFTNFRLNSSRIDCDISSQDTYTGKNIAAYNAASEMRLKLEQSGKMAVRDNTATPVIDQQNRMFVQGLDNDEADKKAKELRELIKKQNNLGDLGMENYCSNNLKVGLVADQAMTIEDDLKKCDEAREKGNIKVLNSSSCSGYPQSLDKKLKTLEKDMKAIQKEMDNKGWQPLVVLNGADKKIYTQFKNDLKKLHEAQTLAKKSMDLSYKTDNYLKSNDITGDLDKVTDCGGDDDVLSEEFMKGAQCGEAYSPATNLVTEFKPDIKALKKVHQENLITELNVQAFGEAIKSKYYLLAKDDPLKSIMYNSPEKACDLVAGAELCKNKVYKEMFVKASKEASSYKDPHFLSYKTSDAVDYYNTRLSWMNQFCSDYLLARDNPLIQINPESVKYFENLYKELVSGPLSPYLYNDRIRNSAKIEVFRGANGQYCSGFTDKTYASITSADIEAARDEFQEATNHQLELCADFSSPDRGGHSNKWGAVACGYGSMAGEIAINAVSPALGTMVSTVSPEEMQEKNNLYALNALFQGHPYIAGKMLKGLDISERKVYASVICDAKKCNGNVDGFNEDVKMAAKVALVAANFIPVVGEVVSIAGTAVLEISDAVGNKLKADDHALALNGGIVSGGFSPDYEQKVGDILTELAEEGDTAKLVKEIAVVLATSAFEYKGSKMILHNLPAFRFKDKYLEKAQEEALNKLFGNLVARVGEHPSEEKVKFELEKMSNQKMMAPSFKKQE